MVRVAKQPTSPDFSNAALTAMALESYEALSMEMSPFKQKITRDVVLLFIDEEIFYFRESLVAL